MSKITFELDANDPKASAFVAAILAVMGGASAPVVTMNGKTPAAASAAPAGTKPTLESLRAQVTGAKDKREQMKAALAKYDATSVSTLAVENYDAFQVDIDKILKG